MAETIYDELLRTGQQLLQYQGYLGPEEKKQQLKVEAQFNSQRNAIVYKLLAGEPDADAAVARTQADFAEIRSDTEDYLVPIVDYVEGELVAHIVREGGKSPLRRRVAKWTPVGLAVVATAVYFGIALTSVVTVDQPIETRAGIEQRAHAYQKARRYDEWTDTRRNRLMAQLLFWPISPSEAEVKAAGEFAGLAFEARAALRDANIICNAPADGLPVAEADLAMLDRVAAYLRDGKTVWTARPPFTLLSPIREVYRCG